MEPGQPAETQPLGHLLEAQEYHRDPGAAREEQESQGQGQGIELVIEGTSEPHDRGIRGRDPRGREHGCRAGLGQEVSELNRAIARQLVASLEFLASLRETSEVANDFLEKAFFRAGVLIEGSS